MLKAALITSTLTLLFLDVFLYQLYRYVDCGPAQGVNCVCSDRMKKAIYRMGNKKTYRILPDKTLQVKVQGQWLKLKY